MLYHFRSSKTNERVSNIHTVLKSQSLEKRSEMHTVFSHIRPAGLIFSQGLELQVVLRDY